MTVYVDDMQAAYGRMLMCHMVGPEEELHAMADLIGVSRRWYQGDHYDVCRAKRALAVKAGAREITQRQMAAMVAHRRATGELGDPEEAIAWFKASRRLMREEANPRVGREPCEILEKVM